MKQRIAIVGWGSLLWEGGVEFDRWHDDWEFDGPELELEFSRISKSRLGALTLVIDSTHGTKTTVAWCRSKRQQPEDAIADLRCREGVEIQNIRSVAPAADLPEDKTAQVLWAWGKERKLDLIVWTALPSNFEEKVKEPFSQERAVCYLKELPPDAKAKAAEYIWRSPKFVQTPLRIAMQSEPWFSHVNPHQTSQPGRFDILK